MQTPCVFLSYQTLTSRNCKLFRTQLCSLQLAVLETQTFKTTVLPMGTHLKLHASDLKQIIQMQTHPLHYLNAYLDP